ncbi:MAG: SRPBCC family protein [Tepidiformaceae bacterium]
MRFEHTIDINASPAQVWAILSDVARWSDWTPTVKSFEWVEGDTLAVGAKARVEVHGAPKGVWTVTNVDDGRSFQWVFDKYGTHTVGGHVVDPRDGGSRVTLTLEQTGFVATLLKPMISRVSRRNLPIEAEGLKRASESRVAA